MSHFKIKTIWEKFSISCSTFYKESRILKMELWIMVILYEYQLEKLTESHSFFFLKKSSTWYACPTSLVIISNQDSIFRSSLWSPGEGGQSILDFKASSSSKSFWSKPTRSQWISSNKSVEKLSGPYLCIKNLLKNNSNYLHKKLKTMSSNTKSN